MPTCHSKSMRILLLIPSVLKIGVEDAVASGHHPIMDYYALSQRLCAHGDDKATDGARPHTVDLLDYSALEDTVRTDPRLRLALRLGGKDAALALLGFQRRGTYDVIFTNGENVAIPLALLLKTDSSKRPGHVTIGHRLSSGKKRRFFQNLRVQEQIDTIFVYSSYQHDFAVRELAIAPEKVPRIAFHADARFYHVDTGVAVQPNRISAAGLEWRDYPTLIEAVASMPELDVRLAAASPWSKHTDETRNRTLPPNVDARRYDYPALRELYASSLFVVVPLYENDFQAGVTSLLEAMAMGKAVIVTQTTGQTDVVIDGYNGITVPPGDVTAWRSAIIRLREDAPLRERLGVNARRWVEEHATLDLWADTIATSIVGAGSKHP